MLRNFVLIQFVICNIPHSVYHNQMNLGLLNRTCVEFTVSFLRVSSSFSLFFKKLRALSRFMPLVFLYPLKTSEKRKSFLMFSWDIERDQWYRMG